jgi:Flp pilus assembly protein TadG
MVTAETAVVLPVLVLVLAAAVGALVVVAAQLRCIDAAREAVRAAARGEDPATVAAVASVAAPDGARVEVTAPGADTVGVTVRAAVAPLSPFPWRFEVSATAMARPEPGASGP